MIDELDGEPLDRVVAPKARANHRQVGRMVQERRVASVQSDESRSALDLREERRHLLVRWLQGRREVEYHVEAAQVRRVQDAQVVGDPSRAEIRRAEVLGQESPMLRLVVELAFLL